MFKALLLATWHDLSDVTLAEALSDRASFRRFCGFSRDEETPERTAFVRFRRELVAQGLDRSLFAAIACDLESKGAVVRKGTLIDATVIGSAAKGDKEAAWMKHRTRPPAHGYKAHIAADKDTGIIRAVETTPANEPDVAIAPSIIPEEARRGLRRQSLLMRWRSKRPSKPRAELRSSCARAIAGCPPQGSKRTIVRCGPFAPGSRKSSALGSAAIIFVACDGSGSPRPSAKSISPPLLTTSNAIGACKVPERNAAAPAKSMPQSPSARRQTAIFERRGAKLPLPSCGPLQSLVPPQPALPRPGLETFW
jgi:IS5 family transposase